MTKFTKLSKKATEIFFAILDHQPEGSEAFKIDNNKPGSGLMPLSVDYLGNVDLLGQKAKLYSFAHNYFQEGDVMKDPDIEFAVIDNRTPENRSMDLTAVIPCLFQQDGIFARITETIVINCGKATGQYRPKALREIVTFSNQWMENIKWQQNIKVPPAQKAIPKPSIMPVFRLAQQVAKEMGYASISDAMKSKDSAEYQNKIGQHSTYKAWAQ